VRTEVLDVAGLDELEGPWRRLAESGDNVFATFEWSRAWWESFGRGRRLRVVGCHDDRGRLAALVPLYEATRRPARVLRLVGHGMSDELGAVGAAPRALREGLRALAGWDLAIFDDLPGDCDGPGRLLGARPSPVVTLGRDWPAGRSRNFRHQIGALERRLARRGPLRFRVADDLVAFRVLHEARWGAGSRAFAGRWQMHERFAADARERGWLRVHLLELDARPVAALYNLRFGAVECFYQSGRDPTLAGAGLVLHAHAIRAAQADGLSEYRFLRGGEAYKLRFADADRAVRTFACARGPRGTALARAIASAGALPRPLRVRVPAALAWGSGAAPARGGG
jgi:CelD/BcsL family acetyltransferase involved in cellulose biosynthesis